MPSCTWLRRAANGGRSPRNLHPTRLFRGISTGGRETAPERVLATRWSWRRARRSVARRARVPASSIASRSRRRRAAGRAALMVSLSNHDAGKKIKGRKRHIVTDTQGHLVGLQVHPADIQDRDGAIGVLTSIRHLYPWLRHIFADGAYAGDKLSGTLAELGRWTFEIIKRSDTAQGFEVLPRRWVVERTFAWLGRCRRLAKDFEATIASAVAWVFVAHIRTLTRRLARL